MHLRSKMVALALSFAGTMPVVAFAPDWVSVSKNGSNVIYVDRASAIKIGLTVKYWVRQDYQESKFGWKQTKTLNEVNCATEQTRILQSAVYLANGQAVTDASPTQWIHIVPGTIGEVLNDYACSL